jgi:hypothetical protein
MKTDVMSDILCTLLDDELLIFRRDFQLVLLALQKFKVDYCLVGDVAISGYREPFATVELEIQLLSHPIGEVLTFLDVVNLKVEQQVDALKITSQLITDREYKFHISLYSPIPFVTKNYSSGYSAVVFGIENIPILDINMLIWYLLFTVTNTVQDSNQQYQVHLSTLLKSPYYDFGTVCDLLTDFGQLAMIELFEHFLEKIDLDRKETGLNWAEVQELKRRQFLFSDY